MLPLDSDSWFAAGALLSPREEADLDFDDVQEADPGCEADAWEPSSFRRLSGSLPLKEVLACSHTHLTAPKSRYAHLR